MQHTQLHLTAPDRAAVLTKAALRAATRLGLSGKRLSDVIDISEAQVSRMKRGETVLSENSKAFELAAMLVRVFRSLDAIVGGDDAVARRWLMADNTALGARPVDRMVSVQGLADVVAYLDARRAPI